MNDVKVDVVGEKRNTRSLPALLLVLLCFGVAAGLAYVAQFTRQPPNYTKIEDRLYVGGYVAKPPPGTRVVLNLCKTQDTYTVDISRWEPIDDAELPPNVDWLRRQVEFIDAHHTAGHTVYVHCRHGVNRSGMVIVAYYMFKKRWSVEQALAFVRTKRAIIRPNPVFKKVLSEWERIVLK
jgi:hypothetical protein